MTVDAGQLVRAVDRLADHVGHWTPARWAQPAATGDRTRAEVVHALAQRLADLEASVTGRPILPVPRLSNDLALPDQVRVMVLDLLAVPVAPEVLAQAHEAISQARAAL
jgi:phosphoribosylcarboxyaminoimidazole (NCAIR) mutase